MTKTILSPLQIETDDYDMALRCYRERKDAGVLDPGDASALLMLVTDPDKLIKMMVESDQKQLKHKDKLPGGRADKLKPADFDSTQLAAGTKHEREHTKDKQLAQEIAMDHLAEDPAYYVKLHSMEKALPKKSSDEPVKKTPTAKASGKKQGAGSKKTRYSYPDENDKKRAKKLEMPGASVKSPAQQVSKDVMQAPKAKVVNPEDLANKIKVPLQTLKGIAQRFTTNSKLGGQQGFVKFMASHLKPVIDKYKLDGDYLNLLWSALTKPSEQAKPKK